MTESIDTWLASHGLAELAPLFERERITLDVLPRLGNGHLKELGLPLGDRLRLLAAIETLASPVLESSGARDAKRTKPSTEGERRQLTVLFCDMVGFTELANRLDPEVLRSIIRSYEDACAVCVTRYEGYVFQRLGDGIVAFFGYPLAHEGEAERAIRAGLQIMDALSKLDVPEVGHLQVRIGIATGVVVVSSAEKGAVGETMNLAARLQVIAQPGSIVVSERVHRLAGGAFDYEDMGEQTLKGIARPTHAFRILGVSTAASRFEAATHEGLTPLVGREPEIGHLAQRWQRARKGEGQVVLLSGEPGIGKSRILSALRERLQNEVKGTLRYQCSPYYVNSAFYPSIDNFERALKFGRDEAAGSKLDKLEALIVTHYGWPLADVRFIASILSIPTDERYGPLTMTPQKQKDETIRVLVDLAEAAARREPSLMLFEDAHWADPTTLEVLDLLIDRARHVPLLIVITHRPEFQPTWGTHGHVTALNLSKLTRAQSGAMVSKLASGKALPAELLEQILTRTDGVPLFVEELTKSILESGELKEADDRYEYVGSARSITIPATLRDSLMARLDRSAPVKEIAQIGAAIGREFRYELIAAVASRSKADLDAALEQLTESGLAFRRGTAPDAVYTFKHALVQDAAYDSLLKSQRAQLHARIAKVLEERFPQTKENEPELLAHHHTEATLNERAIPLWQKAGELAMRRMALREAIGHLDRGLDVVKRLPASSPRDAFELDLRATLGSAWMALYGWAYPKVAEHLEAAWKLALSLNRHHHTVRILWGLWVYQLCIGELRWSLRHSRELLEQARKQDNEDMRIAGHWAAAFTHCWMGEHEESLRHVSTVQSAYDPIKHRGILDAMNHDAKCVTSVVKSTCEAVCGYADQAIETLDECIAHARHLGNGFNLTYVLTYGAIVYGMLGDQERMSVVLEESRELSEKFGLPFFGQIWAPIHCAWLTALKGQHGEAISDFARTVPGWTGGGSQIILPLYLALQAESSALCGDLDKSELVLTMAIEQIQRPGWEEAIWLAEVFRCQALIAQLRHDNAGAEQRYRSAIELARSQKAKTLELRASVSLARLVKEQGRSEEARALLKPVYAWFTEGFDTKDLKEAKALLSELA